MDVLHCINIYDVYYVVALTTNFILFLDIYNQMQFLWLLKSDKDDFFVIQSSDVTALFQYNIYMMFIKLNCYFLINIIKCNFHGYYNWYFLK